ncbi:MAG: transporter related, partial [bacterium]|nr:transporter related [bacterium]
SAWHRRREAPASMQTSTQPSAVSLQPSAPEPKKAEAKARKLTFKEKQELEGIEAAISTAESKMAELQATLEDPTIYKSRSAEVPALVAALDAARADVDRLYARWQELEALR